MNTIFWRKFNLLETLDGLANSAANFRQLPRPKNKGSNTSNHHQLRDTKPK